MDPITFSGVVSFGIKASTSYWPNKGSNVHSTTSHLLFGG